MIIKWCAYQRLILYQYFFHSIFLQTLLLAFDTVCSSSVYMCVYVFFTRRLSPAFSTYIPRDSLLFFVSGNKHEKASMAHVVSRCFVINDDRRSRSIVRYNKGYKRINQSASVAFFLSLSLSHLHMNVFSSFYIAESIYFRVGPRSNVFFTFFDSLYIVISHHISIYAHTHDAIGQECTQL